MAHLLQNTIKVFGDGNMGLFFANKVLIIGYVLFAVMIVFVGTDVRVNFIARDFCPDQS